jgi:hypothetical protein
MERIKLAQDRDEWQAPVNTEQHLELERLLAYQQMI